MLISQFMSPSKVGFISSVMSENLLMGDRIGTGTVFDVTHKKDTYGKGGSYNLFAGKDASKALGKSSLKEEDASPDYSELPLNELKVLNDWHDFFS